MKLKAKSMILNCDLDLKSWTHRDLHLTSLMKILPGLKEIWSKTRNSRLNPRTFNCDIDL